MRRSCFTATENAARKGTAFFYALRKEKLIGLSEIQGAVSFTGEGFPDKPAVFQNHIAAGRIFLRQGNGARIAADKGFVRMAEGDMGMAVQKDIPCFQGREMILVVQVAMRDKDAAVSLGQEQIIRHHGEGEHHLIHLRLAVSADAVDFIAAGIQERDDLLRGIAVGQIIAWTVIQQISEKQKTVRLLAQPLLHAAGRAEGA